MKAGEGADCLKQAMGRLLRSKEDAAMLCRHNFFLCAPHSARIELLDLSGKTPGQGCTCSCVF